MIRQRTVGGDLMRNEVVYLFENIARFFRKSKELRGMSESTISAYTGDLRQFLKFLKSNNISSDVRDITPGHIESFLISLDVSNNTRHRKKNFISAVFEEAIRMGYITTNPARSVQIKRKVVSTRKTFIESHKVVKELLINGNNVKGYNEEVLYAVKVLLFFTGVRISEAIKLYWEHLDFEKMLISIYDSKNTKEKVILII